MPFFTYPFLQQARSERRGMTTAQTELIKLKNYHKSLRTEVKHSLKRDMRPSAGINQLVL